MNDDIKPGQVWAWNADIDADESQFRITAVEGDRARYEYVSENDPHLEGGFFHTVDTLTEKAHLVSEHSTTPAPLDPSKVKAGDMVTLELDGALVRDEVHASWATPSATSMTLKRNGLYNVADGAWTITDHRPAPEPEPEWEPGMLLLGNLAGSGMDDRFFFTDGNGGRVLVSDDGGTWDPGELLNAREAVVIDPAAVDVDTLVDTFCAALDTATREGIIAVLGELGIEAS